MDATAIHPLTLMIAAFLIFVVLDTLFSVLLLLTRYE
jgi:hypothetical protein